MSKRVLGYAYYDGDVLERFISYDVVNHRRVASALLLLPLYDCQAQHDKWQWLRASDIACRHNIDIIDARRFVIYVRDVFVSKRRRAGGKDYTLVPPLKIVS